MRIGVFGGPVANGPMDTFVEDVRAAAAEGFPTYWLPQIFGFEALAALAVAGREVPGIELATGVVPTYPRHPVTLAQEALTAQAASGNRLLLGIGLSHQPVIEGMFGQSFDKPLRHMREYLSVLVPLTRGEPVSFPGDVYRVNAGIEVKGADAVPILLAALGPKMLELAGTVVDGTVTWMTGPKTLESHVIPTITAAASRAGRPAPRVAAGLPICVTDDADAARERAARAFQMYGALPSYRAMLDREGVEGPADVAIVGDEGKVGADLDALAAMGTTDFVASIVGSADERARTRAFLSS
ncbi:MAG: TIGR03564 family F420-dependent LLM class oxidoreductase, partial [Actinobacteria bacterium]|nr:TIGR03564 family F420-dependent LLM class oxidoreductase [Actinomycetota bacterium]